MEPSSPTRLHAHYVARLKHTQKIKFNSRLREEVPSTCVSLTIPIITAFLENSPGYLSPPPGFPNQSATAITSRPRRKRTNWGHETLEVRTQAPHPLSLTNNLHQLANRTSSCAKLVYYCTTNYFKRTRFQSMPPSNACSPLLACMHAGGGE